MDEELDLDFDNLSKSEILAKYSQNLNILQNFAEKNNISNPEFDKLVTLSLNRPQNWTKSWAERFLVVKLSIEKRQKLVSFLALIILGFAFFYYKQEVESLFLRHVQVYIYPGMKLWRKLTAPLILFFPSLTELYDESCLVTNPFFQVDGLNCAPCSSVVNVLDLTNIEQVDLNENIPFMFKTDQREISFRYFFDFYDNNKEVFMKDAYKVKSSNPDIKNLDDLGVDLLNRTNRIESHNILRINRMSPARVLRQYFTHPKRLPKTGIALERFLILDTPDAMPYRIPDPECANVFLIQVQGNRKIVLRPTVECKSECRTLSIRLPTGYALKYNWWYYKPISLADEIASSNSVTYIGSYC